MLNQLAVFTTQKYNMVCIYLEILQYANLYIRVTFEDTVTVRVKNEFLQAH